MKTEKRTFDVGLYTYRPQVHGLICPTDEAKLKSNEPVAILLPMQKVDPRGLYCFGVTSDKGTLSMMRKNVKFKKTVTLVYEREPLATYTQELHAKLNAVQVFMSKETSVGVQLALATELVAA